MNIWCTGNRAVKGAVLGRIQGWQESRGLVLWERMPVCPRGPGFPLLLSRFLQFNLYFLPLCREEVSPLFCIKQVYKCLWQNYFKLIIIKIYQNHLHYLSICLVTTTHRLHSFSTNSRFSFHRSSPGLQRSVAGRSALASPSQEAAAALLPGGRVLSFQCVCLPERHGRASPWWAALVRAW